MSEQEKQENQKTIVAFAAGLLIGGLLVWVFGGVPKAESPSDEITEATSTEQTNNETNDEEVSSTNNTEDVVITPVKTLTTGEGEIEVSDQKAGTSVTLDSAVFPSDSGWIGVRDYASGQLAGLLGVVRFSKEQGLVPEEIVLQRATQAGNSYAVVFYSENGDDVFSLADDVQVEGVFATFTAN
jgi:hypothetical protein